MEAISKHKIPVHIITGFLGAGKTTCLNQWIIAFPHLRILVIENEIGRTNIDGGLIIDAAEDIMELTAGCLCCNLNEKFLLLVNKHQIYRVKGLVSLYGVERRMIVQSVYQSFRFTEGSLWQDDEVRESHQVLIGKEIEKSSIERI